MEWLWGIFALTVSGIGAAWDWANAHWLAILVILILVELQSVSTKLNRIEQRLNVMQMDDQQVRRTVENIDAKTYFRDS
ncbi:hypothetical protein KDW55_12645 [Burkholderia sp. AU19243]|uniref:hypothetical protein n=1 Tax=Burkholderia sp. AU19243 TaxID=2824810 RepID=UPI001B960582|nr:hypothetical protein [Burkholderia sp. AU19243]MBR8143029.1 hypothetical protein [Burkholderia vietnamiensis]MBR8364176.1 hypothetical protein [Burkholderia sp. AU19243]